MPCVLRTGGREASRILGSMPGVWCWHLNEDEGAVLFCVACCRCRINARKAYSAALHHSMRPALASTLCTASRSTCAWQLISTWITLSGARQHSSLSFLLQVAEREPTAWRQFFKDRRDVATSPGLASFPRALVKTHRYAFWPLLLIFLASLCMIAMNCWTAL